MFTVETALDALKKYDIDENTLLDWESQLGLMVPADEYGRRQYSPHHINLFKNVKKHLTLGRSLAQIKEIITLPPASTAKPHTQTATIAPMPKASKAYASAPRRPVVQGNGNTQGIMQLMEKLMGEKDRLNKKLVETEKLNSHLYNANSMFHRKVKELTGQISELKQEISVLEVAAQENDQLKFLEEKAGFHKQILDSEKLLQLKDQQLEAKVREIQAVQQKLRESEQRLRHLTHNFDTACFMGDWLEKAQLFEIAYDNFGINIETERERVFRIAEQPMRSFGNTVILTTHFEYETNSLWKRTETQILAYMADAQLSGELVVEYILDGVPVAKANYRVTCQKSVAPTKA